MRPSHGLPDDFFGEEEIIKNLRFRKLKTKFENFFFYKIELPIKDFTNGIKNFISFRKVIWNFRTWDYTYSLEILRESLKQQRDGINNFSLHVDKERYEMKQLNEIIEILDRILADNYGDLVGIQYDKVHLSFEPVEGTTYSEMKTKYSEDYTEEEHDRLHKLAQEMERIDKKRFGKLMSKYDYWWH